ncbi:FAD-binding protein, partial [Myxococcota bacterium]|nr:FAD-binding protein [Myxococcota bacterium]
LMGRGSNILASDRGVEAVVVKFNAPFFKKASISGNLLTVNSGLSLGRLVQLAKNHSLSGAEFLAGIPGTVGGALAMNAGGDMFITGYTESTLNEQASTGLYDIYLLYVAGF